MNLIGTACVKMEEFGDVLSLPHGLLKHFSSIDCLNATQLFRLCRQQITQLAQQFASLRRQGIGPFSLAERVMSCFDCTIYVGCGCFGNGGPRLSNCRINAFKCFSIFSIYPFTADQHLIMFKIAHYFLPLLLYL
ncbi:MAG: hypothetical protein ACJAUZ_003129 [Flavobacteriaceae bacterium]|jgi:hypothetical protein